MNGDYAAELAEMRRRLGEGGFVVYFADVRSSSGPSEAELVETLALQVTARTADGILYALGSRP